MVTLYGRCTKENITLKSALEKCASALSKAVAIIYSPTFCQFAKVDENGNLINMDNQCLPLDRIFELRAFNQNCELRWLNELNGNGKAVLLSEQNIANYLDESISKITALDTIDQEYILWGKGIENKLNSEWVKLATARIGSIEVPVRSLRNGERVYLKAIEYLEVIDDNSNVGVVEERLKGLEVK
ncbi:MAG TPA: CRISPR-associated protein Csx19 [Nostocaceae cyanobacterium]|nr:CRISPR-associated protein Csx19 [Nostocaceae cyanobacterium]